MDEGCTTDSRTPGSFGWGLAKGVREHPAPKGALSGGALLSGVLLSGVLFSGVLFSGAAGAPGADWSASGP